MRSTISDILNYLSIYRKYIGKRLYIVFALSMLASVMQAFGITLLLPLIRATQSEGAVEEMGSVERILYDILSFVGVEESILGILSVMVVVFVLKGGVHFAQRGYNGYLQSRLLRELKTQLFDLYMNMSYGYYIKNNAGHFINVINQQVMRFFLSFQNFVGFLMQVITAVSYFAFAFAITWKFSLLTLAVGASLLPFFKRLNRYIRELSRRRSTEMSQLNKLLVQALQSFKYVVSTGQTTHLRSGVVRSVKRITDYVFRQRVAGAFSGSLKEPLSVIIISGIIFLQVGVFNDPIAPIFVALVLFHRGIQSVVSIQTDWQKTMDRIGSLEMVDDEFEGVRRHQESGGSQRPGSLSERIEFQNVYFSYDDASDYALCDIDITIPANTTIALVGESGAGKSTLVDMMTLMLRPDEGEVYVDGVKGREIDLEAWRSQIGYVSQETVIFDDTVANNISLWRGNIEKDPAHRERVQSAARKAHAHHFIQELPNGYQTVVGDRGVRLSGGQRQRLFVARELFKEPNLLILDEATSALDTESERYIQESIDAMKGEVTVVIIAHRLSTVKNVYRVYVLEEGRVIEDGSYNKLKRRNSSKFREMVEMQSLN